MSSIINSLLRRAASEGVEIAGITPTDIPGRGIGLVATRNLKEGEIIMVIPNKAVRSLHSIPKSISRQLPKNMSIHGLLAAELALHDNTSTAWARLIPKWADFEAAMPYLWPKELQALLPAEAKGILSKQHTKFTRDWDMFRNGFANKSRQDYLYAWLLVNTRSFDYETPAMSPVPWHDRLALLPLADLFNHAATGCSVLLSTKSYGIKAERSYHKGDEVCISYGEHSSDYLLAEYGFLLDENPWDTICLDDLIIPKLSREHKSKLEENGRLGNFMLHTKSKKHDNVWIALRLLCGVDSQWQSYIGGEEDDEGTLAKAIELLPVLLEEYLTVIKDTRKELRALHSGKRCQEKVLARRWGQVEAMVRQVMATKWPIT